MFCSEFAETVNGRIAQVAFPLALGQTFQGDILTQVAEHPIKVRNFPRAW